MSGAVNFSQGERGFSFIELLVVIVIISIVAALALMQRGSANEQFQRQNVARELKVAFERARFDSVKRRADGTTAAPFAYVDVDTTSFTLRTFANDTNGVATANDQTYPFPAGITAAGYQFSMGGVRRVSFNRRGEATMAANNPQFMICNGTCPTAPGSSVVSNTVLVTPTGTVNLLAGGQTIPTFPTPSTTPVPTNAGVKDEAVLP